MLKALEAAKVSPKVWRLNSWVGVCWDSGRQAKMARNPRGQGLGQSLWDVSLLCSPTLDATAYVIQGNLQVLRIIRGCFLQKIPDLHKSL